MTQNNKFTWADSWRRVKPQVIKLIETDELSNEFSIAHQPMNELVYVLNPLSPDINMHILLTVLHVSYDTT